MSGNHRERLIMAGGAPIDCAQPLKHHIMAKHVHITAPGMALEAMPIMPMKALAKSRYDKAGGHEALDVAVVGDEPVDKLAYGVGEEECRTDDTELCGVEGTAVDNRFFITLSDVRHT